MKRHWTVFRTIDSLDKDTRTNRLLLRKQLSVSQQKGLRPVSLKLLIDVGLDTSRDNDTDPSRMKGSKTFMPGSGGALTSLIRLN